MQAKGSKTNVKMDKKVQEDGERMEGAGGKIKTKCSCSSSSKGRKRNTARWREGGEQRREIL